MRARRTPASFSLLALLLTAALAAAGVAQDAQAPAGPVRPVPGLLLTAALAAAGVAQDAQAPAGPVRPVPGAQPQQQPPAKQQEEAIRVRVDLVSTPVTVRDASGELVYDLTASNFRVLDNGVEQRIEDFELGGNPISAALVFQTSSRIEPMLPAVRKSAILFSQVVLGQTGEAAVLAFDDRVERLLDFTADKEKVEKTIATLPPGTSGSRLHDALATAVGMLRLRPPDRRRVLIVVSEAHDIRSETPLGAVLREAQLNQITVYTVGLSTTAAMLRGEPQETSPSPYPPGVFPQPGIPGSVQTPTTEQQRRGQVNLMNLIAMIVQTASNAVGQNDLELVAAGTGGMHLPTFRDRSIEKAIDEIGGELHAQYQLTYRPRGIEPAGYHEIRIEVDRPGLYVRARPGYYLAPPE